MTYESDGSHLEGDKEDPECVGSPDAATVATSALLDE